MERQQFWETLKNKYEEKNRILQQREEELRLKLDALDAIVGCSGSTARENVQKTVPVITNSQNVDKTSKSSTNQPLTSIASRKTNEEVIATYHMSDNMQNAYDHINFKSCICPPAIPPPSEKPGIFNCIWSIFGSTKLKPPSTPPPASAQPTEGFPSPNQAPPAPPDEPTKENVQQSEIIQEPNDLPKKDETNVEPNLYKNENCMCNPCAADFLNKNGPEKSSQSSRGGGSENTCNCSICTKASFNTPVTQIPENVPKKPDQYSKIQGSEISCNCSICTRGSSTTPNTQNLVNVPEKMSQDPKKQESGSICNCSICTRNKGMCPCNLVPTNVGANIPQTIVDSNGDKISKGIEQLNTSMQGQSDKLFSNLSLKSLDLFYMQNIHDLATQEKNMLNQINALEKKNKIYEDVLKEYKNVDFCSKGQDSPCPCYNVATPKDSDSKNNAELKLENFLLKNELKDMKLEIRQYIERMEGPMQFKIETEKYKCCQLEQKLEEAAKEMASLQELYQKEMNALKFQLCSANANIYNLTAQNSQLTEDIKFFEEKCTKLEEDLIRQKLSEAETIKSLQAAVNAQPQTNADVVTVAKDVKDECDLHQIARELSKVLKECEPCGDCLTLPEDLTATAMLLKSLTDMIDKKFNDGEEVSSKLLQSTDVKETTETTGPKITTEPLEAAECEKPVETTDKAEAPAATTESLGVVVTQEVTSAFGQGDQISEKISGKSDTEKISKKESISPSADQPEKINEVHQQNETQQNINEPDLDKKSGQGSQGFEPDKKSEESAKISEADKKSERSTKLSDEDKKSQQSGKLSEAEKKSERSAKISEADKKSERSTRRSEADEKAEKSSKRSREISVSEPAPKPRTSCKCVKSRKSTPPVDQIWPETDKPVVMKDSSVLETTAVPDKKKCDCNVAKKLREQAQSQKKTKKPCTCSSITREETKEVKSQHPEPQAVDRLRPDDSERFKVSHQVTASRSKELLKSETSIKCLKVKENFPFDVDTQVDVLNKPPNGIHVTTTITKSGTLEVITEGPEGVIETTLIYTKSGNVEVVTEILEFQGKGKVCKSGKSELPAVEAPEIKALEAPKPEESPEKATTDETQVQSGGFVSPNCQCRQCPGLMQGTLSQAGDTPPEIPKTDSGTPKSEERKSQVSAVEKTSKTGDTLEETGDRESSAIVETSKTGETPEDIVVPESSITTYDCLCQECLSMKSGECLKEANDAEKVPDIGSTVDQSEQEKSQVVDIEVPDSKTSEPSKPEESPEGPTVIETEVPESQPAASICGCCDCPSSKLKGETPAETKIFKPDPQKTGLISPNCQCSECPSLKPADTPKTESEEISPTGPEKMDSKTEDVSNVEVPPVAANCICQSCPSLQQKITQEKLETKQPEFAESEALSQDKNIVPGNVAGEITDTPGDVVEESTDIPGDAVEATTKPTEDATDIKDATIEESPQQVVENPEILQTLSMSMHVENENDLPATSGEENQPT